MQYVEFIHSAADKTLCAVEAGNYTFDMDIDTTKILSEDDAIEAVAMYIQANHKHPQIQKVTTTGYRISS